MIKATPVTAQNSKNQKLCRDFLSFLSMMNRGVPIAPFHTPPAISFALSLSLAVYIANSLESLYASIRYLFALLCLDYSASLPFSLIPSLILRRPEYRLSWASG